MSKKNKVAARREAHERLLERERQQKAKKEAKKAALLKEQQEKAKKSEVMGRARAAAAKKISSKKLSRAVSIT